MSEETVVLKSTFTTSDEIGQLTAALAAARDEFKPVVKDATNPFFKAKYADLAGVIESTSPALSKNKLAVIQSPRMANGHVIVTTLLAHASGEWIKDELELPTTKYDAQGAGSAITYARRYAYQAIVGVAAEDDDGNAASEKSPTFTKSGDGTFSKQESKPAKKSSPPVKAQPAPSPAAPSNKITPENPITDNDLPDILRAPEGRPATNDELKAFKTRLIAIKDKGYTGLAPWILKTTGKPRTDDVPFDVLAKIVDQVEAAEKAGTLKDLLA